VKGAAVMKPMVLTKKREGAISEMEKLLTKLTEAQLQENKV
jgi:hypothetical protein